MEGRRMSELLTTHHSPLTSKDDWLLIGGLLLLVLPLRLWLLHNTEVIGGDLLLKRAHVNSVYSDTAVLAADLQIAQDYENYLNNREAINALIAANPAFIAPARYAA